MIFMEGLGDDEQDWPGLGRLPWWPGGALVDKG
jgi:hypothetical protein